MRYTTVLITGFQPFAGMKRNPSEFVVKAVAEAFSEADVLAEILPVEYDRAGKMVSDLILSHQPLAWIGFGLSQRATAITLERLAINLDDATIADNCGELRCNKPIEIGGPVVYPATLPIELFKNCLQAEKIAVVCSDDAGRFVCNHTLYTALHTTSHHSLRTSCGFVHLPWPDDWDDIPLSNHGLKIIDIIAAAKFCVGTILDQRKLQQIA